MTQKRTTRLVCHRQIETMYLWPTTKEAKRTNGVKFSLSPSHAGRDVITTADYHMTSMIRSPTIQQPIRFRCEKSVTCYTVTPKSPEKRFKSTLSLKIPPRCLLPVDAAEDQRFKRGIEISKHYAI